MPLDDQERTEQATPKRREEARKRGQVRISLNGAFGEGVMHFAKGSLLLRISVLSAFFLVLGVVPTYSQQTDISDNENREGSGAKMVPLNALPGVVGPVIISPATLRDSTADTETVTREAPIGHVMDPMKLRDIKNNFLRGRSAPEDRQYPVDGPAPSSPDAFLVPRSKGITCHRELCWHSGYGRLPLPS